MMEIMQGDSYNIPIKLSIDGGIADSSMFSEVEIMIGNIRKTMSGNQVIYNDTNKSFLFPLSQKESFNLPIGEYIPEVRVKLAENGEVLGVKLDKIIITKSKSKVVL